MEKLCENIQRIACLALHLAGRTSRSLFKNLADTGHIDFLQIGYILFGSKFNDCMKTAGESLTTHLKNNICVLTITDKNYPVLLKKSICPPLALFYIGDIGLIQKPLISIVGTREPSLISTPWLEMVCEFLNSRGFVLVSGLATGIDAVVHKHSFSNGTIGICPHSLDYHLPKINKYLFKAAMQGQKNILILSEYPVSTPVRKYHFVHRNRIIAGISQFTIFAEGGMESGAMITANWCLKNQRKLFVLNSGYQKNNSGGCHLRNSGKAISLENVFPIHVIRNPFEKSGHRLKNSFYLGNNIWIYFNPEEFSIKFLLPDPPD